MNSSESESEENFCFFGKPLDPYDEGNLIIFYIVHTESNETVQHVCSCKLIVNPIPIEKMSSHHHVAHCTPIGSDLIRCRLHVGSLGILRFCFLLFIMFSGGFLLPA